MTHNDDLGRVTCSECGNEELYGITICSACGNKLPNMLAWFRAIRKEAEKQNARRTKKNWEKDPLWGGCYPRYDRNGNPVTTWW